MGELRDFAIWAFYVGFILWAAAAAWRRASRRYDQPGEER